MKICYECRWYYREGSYCLHDEAVMSQSPVTGTVFHRRASDMRERSMPCGEEGKLWEAPPPRIHWILRLAAWIDRRIT